MQRTLQERVIGLQSGDGFEVRPQWQLTGRDSALGLRCKAVCTRVHSTHARKHVLTGSSMNASGCTVKAFQVCSKDSKTVRTLRCVHPCSHLMLYMSDASRPSVICTQLRAWNAAHAHALMYARTPVPMSAHTGAIRMHTHRPCTCTGGTDAHTQTVHMYRRYTCQMGVSAGRV